MTAPRNPTKGAMRRWRRAKTEVMCTVLRSIAALEGVPLPATNDAGALRHTLVNSMPGSISTADRRANFTIINAALTRAVGQYLRDNPKPKQGA